MMVFGWRRCRARTRSFVTDGLMGVFRCPVLRVKLVCRNEILGVLGYNSKRKGTSSRASHVRIDVELSGVTQRRSPLTYWVLARRRPCGIHRLYRPGDFWGRATLIGMKLSRVNWVGVLAIMDATCAWLLIAACLCVVAAKLQSSMFRVCLQRCTAPCWATSCLRRHAVIVSSDFPPGSIIAVEMHTRDCVGCRADCKGRGRLGMDC